MGPFTSQNTISMTITDRCAPNFSFTGESMRSLYGLSFLLVFVVTIPYIAYLLAFRIKKKQHVSMNTSLFLQSISFSSHFSDTKNLKTDLCSSLKHSGLFETFFFCKRTFAINQFQKMRSLQSWCFLKLPLIYWMTQLYIYIYIYIYIYTQLNNARWKYYLWRCHHIELILSGVLVKTNKVSAGIREFASTKYLSRTLLLLKPLRLLLLQTAWGLDDVSKMTEYSDGDLSFLGQTEPRELLKGK